MDDDVALLVPAMNQVEVIDISSNKSSSDDTSSYSSSDDTRSYSSSDDTSSYSSSDISSATLAAMESARRQAAAVRRASAVILRGPKNKGPRQPFDNCCVFPNSVSLNSSQVEHLNDVARMNPTRRLYVCTMKASNVKQGSKAKMFFNKKYTNEVIKRGLRYFLPAEIDVYTKNKFVTRARVILSKGKAQGSQITAHWKDVVEATNMETNDIFRFWFHGCGNGLKLSVRKVE